VSNSTASDFDQEQWAANKKPSVAGPAGKSSSPKRIPLPETLLLCGVIFFNRTPLRFNLATLNSVIKYPLPIVLNGS
jgi:hypothetical protein